MNAQPLAPPAVPRAVTSRPARRRAGALALAAVLATGLTVATAQSANADEPAVGSSTLVPIQVTGDPSERFSLVILGDGYTADEQPLFREQVEKHLETMWSIEPYKSYRNYFNVYAVEIISGESGISCDSSLDSPRRNTPLKMSFWGGCNPNSVQRLITMDGAKAREYAKAAPKVDQVLALANSDTYGGAGGSYATASGGNSLSALISPHEIGHSLGGLADEYDYYTRGITTGDYTGGEPRSKHHTIMTVEEMAAQQAKWWRWLGEPSEAGGTIGAYEGGQYYSTGIFRPSRHSMMKTLGYQMDQVSREIMTERISSKIPLIADAPDEATPVAADEVISIDVAHPVYHELDVDWAINGKAVPNPHNTTQLELKKTPAKPGDVVTVTVVDNTPFVRDPALRDSASMTQSRSWTVGSNRAVASDVEPAFTESTRTESPVGSLDVLYVETTHRSDRVFDVIWTVDGVRQPNPHNARTLELAELGLSAGTHTVTASVGDSKRAGAAAETLTWTVDAEGPTVESVVSAPVETSVGANGEPHYVVDGSFTMKLTASDDEAGALVTEFRLDGDGWHNYYGWPTDAEAPFLFTPTGTNVDDLVYGNLGTGGMSLSPFQVREPGYGEHRVEYRSTDAAGNIGPVEAFTVEVRP